MEKIIYLLFVSLMFVSCGGVKTQAGRDNIENPCSGKEFRSNKEYFRATATSFSNNETGAMEDAENQVAGKLALSISKMVKVVSERYSNAMVVSPKKAEFKSVSERQIRSIAKLQLNNLKTICSKTTRDRSTGMYYYYITIETPTDKILEKFIRKIDNDSKSEMNFDRDKFREVFDEEMSKN